MYVFNFSFKISSVKLIILIKCSLRFSFGETSIDLCSFVIDVFSYSTVWNNLQGIGIYRIATMLSKPKCVYIVDSAFTVQTKTSQCVGFLHGLADIRVTFGWWYERGRDARRTWVRYRVLWNDRAANIKISRCLICSQATLYSFYSIAWERTCVCDNYRYVAATTTYRPKYDHSYVVT